MTAGVPLSSGRFQAYLLCQFLGAANDYGFKAAVFTLGLTALAGDEAAQVRYGTLLNFIVPLPFILFSSVAGFLADRFPKHRVFLWTKAPEILAMLLGTVGFIRQDLWFLAGVLFLMDLQSAFFSPAKYGILPEIVAAKDLSGANGLLNMTTNLAVLLGGIAGPFVFAAFRETPATVGLVFTGVAVAGTVAAIFIPAAAPGNPSARFNPNPFRTIRDDLREVRKLPALFHTVIGNAYFSFVASAFMVLIPIYGQNTLSVPTAEAAATLLAFVAVGIAAGSVLAGKLSHGQVEPGLVPLGAVGIGLAMLDFLFFGSKGPRLFWEIPWRAGADLLVLGVSAGFVVVPLSALLQQRAPEGGKGRIIGFSNLCAFSAILAASLFTWGAHEAARLDTGATLMALALVTLGGTAYALVMLPDYFVRLTLWILTNTVYRIRVGGGANIPTRGALFVSNHVSWVDAFLVAAASGRMVRFMMFRPFYEAKALNWFCRRMHVIPIAASDSPRKTVESLQHARREIEAGHVVCIFAEGSISRTGNLLKFRRGFERIVSGLDCPIVPVCLDGVWGSIFSFEGGRFLFKWPKRLRYPVTVLFGKPLPSSATAFEVRQAVQDLSTEASLFRKARQKPLAVSFLATARRLWGRPFVADSQRRKLTFGKALVGTILLKDALFGKDPPDGREPEKVGILLPPSVGGVLANLATLFAGKVPVNLNYTASREAFAHALSAAGIRRVVTADAFLEKLGADLPLTGVALVHLDRMDRTVPKLQAARAWLFCRLLPERLAARFFIDGDLADVDRTATILFSSGSTGTPKGVVLSHYNVLSNLESLRQVFSVTGEDCVLGVLPFFHSFGFTGTLCMPAVAGLSAAYHANPLDAKTIGRLAREHEATILVATPTFLSAYERRIPPEDFRHLRRVVVGAEKLAEPVRKAFTDKYGVEPLEGYGATECAPIVSVNVPDVEENGQRKKQVGNKPGSIGQPLPGISVRIVDPEARTPLPPGTEGLLLVKGPNVMQGYLNDADRTAEALVDGWYVTGDIARLDEDGFLTITDRLSRFAKIAGEMVPLGKVEEAILDVLDRPAEEPAEPAGPALCVTSVPDERKGERIVVLYRKGALDPKAVLERLAAASLPNLWMPRGDAFKEVDAIPLLGTGKIDLRKARELAKA